MQLTINSKLTINSTYRTRYLQPETHIKPGLYWSVDENFVTKGWQEPNCIFSLGAMVPNSLIQYLWQLDVCTMNNKHHKHVLYMFTNHEVGVGASGAQINEREKAAQTQVDVIQQEVA